MINPAPFILKDRNARVGFSYTVTFPVNSMAGFGFTVEHEGQISTVTAMNIASYTLKKNGAAVGVPFKVQKGDTLMIDDVMKINDANPASFIFRAPKFAEQNVQVNALTQIDETRKHLFVVNYTDQTVSVIDTETDTVESTIILPTTGVGQGYEFQSIAYRSADDFIYVFGFSRVCKIDANPASPNFKNVYSNTGVLNGTSNLPNGSASPWSIAVYDSVNDQMILATTLFSTIQVWDFVAISASVASGFVGMQNNAPFYIPNSKIFEFGYIGLLSNEGQPIAYTATEGGGSQQTVKGCYVSKNHFIYAGRTSIKVYNADTLELQKQIATGSSGNSSFAQIVGNVAYAPFYDLVLALTLEDGGGRVTVIDSLTDTSLGSFIRQNKEANDTIARSLVFGAFAKKFYFAGNGTVSPVTRVHKLNPQLWIDNGKADLIDMIDGYITVGDMKMSEGNTTFDARRYACYSMAFNHLIPS